MNRNFALAICAGFSITLVGCSQSPQAPAAATPASARADADKSAPDSALGRLIHNQTSELARQIEREALVVTATDRKLPSARIAPDGTIRIGDEALALTADQRALAARYRQESLAPLLQTMTFAATGMDDTDAILKTYISGFLNDDMEKADAAAREIARESDRKFQSICPNTQAQFDAQTALVAAVPEFAPYAKISKADLDECSRTSADATIS